jgi:hypothetical protein
MRVLGYSKHWPKLQKTIHTTFRMTRRDVDWHTGEYVQEVYHPRSKTDREIINPKSLIFEKVNKWFYEITDAEAVEDGFIDAQDMRQWLKEAHGDRINKERINKLTVRVIKV